ncbi:hypothetical protein Clacol_003979 [Clathrus columnatus]|uniref:Uncharacterized protein n=1 Tax=Clathrus columnatus TaxID=1419009 RepID=A0AAV5AA17_9AGAM|nr:hypothetical protein Clacol_003979 [Clathrus columnatus]
MTQFNILDFPKEYRQLPLKGKLWIEYIQLEDDDFEKDGSEMNNSKMDNFFKKNHVVFQVLFKHKFKVDINGAKAKVMMGVRISMDLVLEGDMNDTDRKNTSVAEKGL